MVTKTIFVKSTVHDAIGFVELVLCDHFGKWWSVMSLALCGGSWFLVERCHLTKCNQTSVPTVGEC